MKSCKDQAKEQFASRIFLSLPTCLHLIFITLVYMEFILNLDQAYRAALLTPVNMSGSHMKYGH